LCMTSGDDDGDDGDNDDDDDDDDDDDRPKKKQKKAPAKKSVSAFTLRFEWCKFLCHTGSKDKAEEGC
jgi:hypothetical protein